MADVDVGTIVHLSDLTLPAKVTSVALSLGDDHDLAVASVQAPKGASASVDEPESDEASSDE